MENMKFTYKAYKKLIETLKNNGYSLADYHNDQVQKKSVVLRHDVDNSLEKALAFAQYEQQLGVKSTYFVLLTSNFYNIASQKSRSILKEIQGMGHEVGLHFDEMAYGDLEKESLIQCVEKEAEIMRQLTGLEISAVSMHRPSKKTLDGNYVFLSLVNSYSQKYFKAYKYLSDSRMHWRENVLEIIESNAFDHLHILTHPFWYNEEEHSMKACLKDFIGSANKERYDFMNENFRDLEDVLKKEEI